MANTADPRITLLKKRALMRALTHLTNLTKAVDKVKSVPLCSEEEQEALAELLFLRLRSDREFSQLARYGEVVSALLEMDS